jgi:hypothetical protein
MSNQSQLPDGMKALTDEAPESESISVIDAPRWAKGHTVVYRGVKDGRKRDGDSFRMHLVSHPSDPDGVKFGVWSTAQLDRLFSRVKIGAVCFLRYDGKQPHPTMEGKEIHAWTVAVAAAAQRENAPAGAEPAVLGTTSPWD